MKRLAMMIEFGGWELVSAAILFGSSLYGFLVSEMAEEVIVAETVGEVVEDVAETIVEEAASS